MKKTVYLIITIAAIQMFFTNCKFEKKETRSFSPVKVIFDTDMGPDFDDVGAIAVLHALEANGECKILATLSSNRQRYIAPTIDAFNRYFKKPGISIGVPVGDGPDFTCSNSWNDSIVTKYLTTKTTNADYPSAVDVYREVLSYQPDTSVVVVTVGFMTNLEDLLKSVPDRFSELSGADLVRKKVKNYVAMAGKFPEGAEFNVVKHSTASEYVFNHWPGQILFSGFEIGNAILTGRRVADQGAENNPISWAYRYCLETYSKQPLEKRQSWDQTAVLCAIRNPADYFDISKSGRLIIDENGYNSWDANVDSGHRYLIHKFNPDSIAAVLDELMMYEP